VTNKHEENKHEMILTNFTRTLVGVYGRGPRAVRVGLTVWTEQVWEESPLA